MYKTFFSEQKSPGWENQVKEIVGRILSTNYDSYQVKVYSKYHLPVVTSKNILYSGFNMGAGENALFEIFSTIFSTPKGTFLVIDEIELGLHEDAQKKLILELKKVCRDRHIQVICTTHSSAILEALPPEARFYVQCYPGSTSVLNGISSLHAAGMLSGENSKELEIFVEDKNAQAIVESFLDNEKRKRVTIIPIGSPQTIVHQMAAKYKENNPHESMAILDGDQRNKLGNIQSRFLRALESYDNEEEVKSWINQRVVCLPGDTWPEIWLVEKILTGDKTQLSNIFGVSIEELSMYLEEAKGAGKHNEFFTLAKNLGLDATDIFNLITKLVVKERDDEFKPIISIVELLLS